MPYQALPHSRGCPSQHPLVGSRPKAGSPALCLPLDVEMMPRVGGGQVAGDQRIWAVGPAGRRWKEGDSKPGFYSQPALGSLFSWGAQGGPCRPVGEGPAGALDALESVRIKRSGPGLGSTCMCGAACCLRLASASSLGAQDGRRECGASAPAWASGGEGADPRRLCCLAPEWVPVMENRRSGIPDVPTRWPRGAEVFGLCPLLPLQPDVWPRTHRGLWFLCGLLPRIQFPDARHFPSSRPSREAGVGGRGS